MAVKVEVVTPVSSVSDVAGMSTAIEVVRNIQSPVTTNSNQAVITVVGPGAVGNVIPSHTAPPNPYNGMFWFAW